MAPDRNHGHGYEQECATGIEHHISEMAGPCWRKALMPLIKRGNYKGARDGQTRPNDPRTVRKGRREGAKPEIAENAVAQEMPSLSQDSVEPIKDDWVRLSEQPGQCAFQKRPGVRRRSEEGLHGNDHGPEHDRQPDAEH